MNAAETHYIERKRGGESRWRRRGVEGGRRGGGGGGGGREEEMMRGGGEGKERLSACGS